VESRVCVILSLIHMSSDIVVNAIVTALYSGALTGAADASKKAISDGYEGLKSLIKKRFGSGSEAAIAVERLETRPDSEGRKRTLSEELESVGVGIDEGMVDAAQALLALIRSLPQGESHVQTAKGTGIAQADRGSTAAVSFSAGFKKDD
jgi:hypothetical protein